MRGIANRTQGKRLPSTDLCERLTDGGARHRKQIQGFKPTQGQKREHLRLSRETNAFILTSLHTQLPSSVCFIRGGGSICLPIINEKLSIYQVYRCRRSVYHQREMMQREREREREINTLRKLESHHSSFLLTSPLWVRLDDLRSVYLSLFRSHFSSFSANSCLLFDIKPASILLPIQSPKHILSLLFKFLLNE
jgi:hypothetical protein